MQVKNNIVPYVQALMDGMPPKCKLPRYEYGTKGQSVCMYVCQSVDYIYIKDEYKSSHH